MVFKNPTWWEGVKQGHIFTFQNYLMRESAQGEANGERKE